MSLQFLWARHRLNQPTYRLTEVRDRPCIHMKEICFISLAQLQDVARAINDRNFYYKLVHDSADVNDINNEYWTRIFSLTIQLWLTRNDESSKAFCGHQGAVSIWMYMHFFILGSRNKAFVATIRAYNSQFQVLFPIV